MPNLVYQTASFLCQLCSVLNIGTNLGIVHLLWTILTGRLLASRGGLFPALADAGFSDKQVRQAEAALREGQFCIQRLLEQQNRLIKQQKRVFRLSIGGYFPVLIDWVGFYRPTLKGCLSKHYSSAAGKALPAVEFGMIARPYQAQHPCSSQSEKEETETKTRRFPVLVGLIRGGKTIDLLKAATQKMFSPDGRVGDRQVKISQLFEAKVTKFVVRGAVDMKARTKEVAPWTGKGRKPTKGSLVRPLSRKYNEKVIPATKPTRTETFCYQGRTLQAERFENLVVDNCPLVFHAIVIRDPRYKTPWLLLTNLPDSSEIIFLLYCSRWKIEQIPQTGKQMLGGDRSFVQTEVLTSGHASEMRHRLPELILLAASVSLYLSAISPVTGTGFWDKHPQRTAGRFRRVLSGRALPDLMTLTEKTARVRNKASVFGHLPMGNLARQCLREQEKVYSLTGK